MNRELTDQDWLNFYEADYMCQVETCRRDDLRNHYGPCPDRRGYTFEEWRRYAESQMWLDKVAEILTTKNKNGNYMTINKKQLAFVLEYLHEDAKIPQPVMTFIADCMRGVGKKGSSKSIVKKWKNRIDAINIAKDAYGNICGGKPNPDLSIPYLDKVADLKDWHGVNEGDVKKALKKFNPKNQ